MANWSYFKFAKFLGKIFDKLKNSLKSTSRILQKTIIQAAKPKYFWKRNTAEITYIKDFLDFSFGK